MSAEKDTGAADKALASALDAADKAAAAKGAALSPADAAKARSAIDAAAGSEGSSERRSVLLNLAPKLVRCECTSDEVATVVGDVLVEAAKALAAGVGEGDVGVALESLAVLFDPSARFYQKHGAKPFVEPDAAAEADAKWRASLGEDSKLDAFHPASRRFSKARVKSVSSKSGLLIEFEGRRPSNNRWVLRDSPHLAPLGTRAVGDVNLELPQHQWRTRLKVDDVCDAADTVGKWYNGVVRKVRKREGITREVFVHYDGWQKSYDEWLRIDHWRLAPRDSEANLKATFGLGEGDGVGTNDLVLDEEDVEREGVFAIYRDKPLSGNSLYIDVLNAFGAAGGFDAVRRRCAGAINSGVVGFVQSWFDSAFVEPDSKDSDDAASPPSEAGVEAGAAASEAADGASASSDADGASAAATAGTGEASSESPAPSPHAVATATSIGPVEQQALESIQRCLREAVSADSGDDSSSSINASEVAALLRCVANAAPSLTRGFVHTYIPDLARSVLATILSFNEASLRSVLKSEQMKALGQAVRDIMRRVARGVRVANILEKASLTLALKLFHTTNMPLRLQGLKIVLDAISKVDNKTATLTTKAILCNFINDVQLIEQVFDPRSSHLEYMKRGTHIIKFLLEHNKLHKGAVDQIWAPSTIDREHEISIYKVLQDLAHTFRVEHLKRLLEKLGQIAPTSYTQETINLTKRLAGMSQHVVELAPGAMSVLWEVAVTSRSDVSLQVAELAKTQLIDLMKLMRKREERLPLALKCVQHLKEHAPGCVAAIDVLSDVIEDYYPTVYTSEEFTRATVIKHLDETVDLLSVLLADISEYWSRASAAAGAEPLDKDAIQFSNTTHASHVSTRLDFLQLVLDASELELNVAQLDELWRLFVTEPSRSEDDGDFLLKWLTDGASRRLSSRSGFLSAEAANRVFEVHLPSIRPQAMTPQSLRCLRAFFMLINLGEDKLEMTSDGSFEMSVQPADATGIDLVWQAALEASNAAVVSAAVDMLNAVHDQLGAAVSSERAEVQRTYVAHLMTTLGKSLGDSPGDSTTAASVASRCLSVLERLLDEADRRGEGGGELRAHQHMRKGTPVTIIMSNNFSPKPRGMPPKMEIHAFTNSTVWEVRSLVAEKAKYPGSRIRLYHKGKELLDVQNAATMKTIGVGAKATFHASLRTARSETNAPLLVDETVTSSDKAVLTKAFQKALTHIFGQYADGGIMKREAICTYFLACGAGKENIRKERIDTILATYDSDNDCLTLRGFMDFYRNASVLRAHSVWKDLTTHGFDARMRLKAEQEQKSKDASGTDEVEQASPRAILMQDLQHFATLFAALDSSNVVIADRVRKLLGRLPTNPELLARLRSLELSDETGGWDGWLSTTSRLQLLYALEVVDTLLAGEAEDVAVDEYDVPEFKAPKPSESKGADETGEANAMEMEDMDASKGAEESKGGQDDEAGGESTAVSGSHGGPAAVAEDPATAAGDASAVAPAAVGESPPASLAAEPEVQVKNEWAIKFVELGGFAHLYKLLSSSDPDQHPDATTASILMLIKHVMVGAVATLTPALSSSIQLKRENSQLADLAAEQDAESTDSDVAIGGAYPGDDDGMVMIGPQLPPDRVASTAQTVEDDAASEVAEEPIVELDVDVAGLVVDAIDVELLQSLLLRILSAVGYATDSDVDAVRNVLGLWTAVVVYRPALLSSVLGDASKAASLVVTLRRLLFCEASVAVRREVVHAVYHLVATVKDSTPSPDQFFLSMLLDCLPASGSTEDRNSEQYFHLLARLLGEASTSGDLSDKRDAFRALLQDLAGRLHAHPCVESRSSGAHDRTLQGLLNTMTTLLKCDETFRGWAGAASPEGLGLLDEVFSNCLFRRPGTLLELEETDGPSWPRCKVPSSRLAAFQLLATICKSAPANAQRVIALLEPVHKKATLSAGWRYAGQYGRSSTGFVGIKNLGCICYMNAMLQQFYMNPRFRYGILSARDLAEDASDSVLGQLQRMYAFLGLSMRQDYHPRGWCDAFKDSSGNPVNVTVQQDAEEFVNVFLDRVDTLLRTTSQRRLVRRLYTGKMANQIICTSCGHLRSKDEAFHHISVEVKNKGGVYEALDHYVSGETITDFNCSACKKRVNIIKRECVSQLPRTLLVHFKRLAFNFDTFVNEKINTRFEFPDVLNMSPYTVSGLEKMGKGAAGLVDSSASTPTAAEDVDAEDSKGGDGSDEGGESASAEAAGGEGESKTESTKADDDKACHYRLIGVLCHMGTAQSGHYYSFIRDPHTGQWNEYNDSVVKPFDLKELERQCFGGEQEVTDTNMWGREVTSTQEQTRNAYMCIYESMKPSDASVEEEATAIVADGKLPSGELASVVDYFRSAAPLEATTATEDHDPLDEAAAPDVEALQQLAKLVSLTNKKQQLEVQLGLVSPDLAKGAFEDNIQYLLDDDVYATSHFTFMAELIAGVAPSLCSSNTYVMGLRADEDAAVELSEASSEQFTTEFCVFSFKFLIRIMSHAGASEAFTKSAKALVAVLNRHVGASQWLLSLMVLHPKHFVDLMLTCSNAIVRQQIASMILAAATCVAPHERAFYLERVPLAPAVPDSAPEEALGDDKGKEAPDQAPAQAGDVSPADTLVARSMVVRLVDKALDSFDDAAKNWPRFEEFFSLLSDIADIGDDERAMMVDRHAISRIVDLYLGDKSPTAGAADAKRAPMGHAAAKPDMKNLLACVCKLALGSVTGGAVARLDGCARSAAGAVLLGEAAEREALGLPPSLAKDCNPSILTDSDLVMLHCEHLYLNAFKENVLVDEMGQLMVHLSWEDIGLSLDFASILHKGLSTATTDAAKPYLKVFDKMARIDDTISLRRLVALVGDPHVGTPRAGHVFGLQATELSGGAAPSQSNEALLSGKLTADDLIGIGTGILGVMYRRRSSNERVVWAMLRKLFDLADDVAVLYDYLFCLVPQAQNLRSSDRYMDWIFNFMLKFLEAQLRNSTAAEMQVMVSQTLQRYEELEAKYDKVTGLERRHPHQPVRRLVALSRARRLGAASHDKKVSVCALQYVDPDTNKRCITFRAHNGREQPTQFSFSFTAPKPAQEGRVNFVYPAPQEMPIKTVIAPDCDAYVFTATAVDESRPDWGAYYYTWTFKDLLVRKPAAVTPPPAEAAAAAPVAEAEGTAAADEPAPSSRSSDPGKPSSGVRFPEALDVEAVNAATEPDVAPRRPGTPPAPATAAASSTSAEWDCAWCTFKNPATTNVCSICSKLKTDTPPY